MAGKPDKTDLEQLLSSYIDGTCSEQERRQVEAGLARDPQLRALHEQLRRTVAALNAFPAEAAPEHVRERILSQLERRALIGAPAGAPAVRGSRRTAWLGLLAAAMLVAGVGATWWVRVHRPEMSRELAMAPAQPNHDIYPALSESAKERSAPPTAVGPVEEVAPPPSPAKPVPEQAVLADRDERYLRRKMDEAAPMANASDASKERDAVAAVPPDEAQPAADAMVAAKDREPVAAVPPPASGGADTAGEPVRQEDVAPAAPASEVLAAAPQERQPGLPAKEAIEPLAQAAPSVQEFAARQEAAASASAPAPADVAFAEPSARIEMPAHRGSDVQPSVVRLEVAVVEPSKVSEMISVARDAVGQQAGQVLRVTSGERESTVVAVVPAGRRGDVVRAMVEAPLVAQVQSRSLAASDPEAREAAELAGVRWLGYSRQLLAAVGGNRAGGPVVTEYFDEESLQRGHRQDLASSRGMGLAYSKGMRAAASQPEHVVEGMPSAPAVAAPRESVAPARMAARPSPGEGALMFGRGTVDAPAARAPTTDAGSSITPAVEHFSYGGQARQSYFFGLPPVLQPAGASDEVVIFVIRPVASQP